MSVDAKKPTGEVAPAPKLVTLTIDGTEVSVPEGTLIIRAAEMIGNHIPRFCDHPLLDPVGACRQCMVDIPDAGNGRGFPKPQASCTMPVAQGMKVNTHLTSPVAEKAQRGMLEFLLINHPLDCPVCDKGGECPLQNQALSHGPGESRFGMAKRTFPKPVSISAQILLDRERCVLCARCTRFSDQISGDPFIELVERGALQQVGVYEQDPYDSYFSGNVVQICPVGALTSAAYRFQARPFDLVSTITTCEHCASGCELRADHRHHQVKRRLAGDDPEVNEEWNCDKGRFGFMYGRGPDRITHPLVRRDGVLVPASWPEAIDAAVDGLRAAGSSVGVQTGGRLTVENAYAYSRFARGVLGTNSIDFRSRPQSAEEADFLAARVAGQQLADSVQHKDLETAKHVVLVALEPEDESPIIFLRLRKGVRNNGTRVTTLAPFASRGSDKLDAEVIPVVPGGEAGVLDQLELEPDAIILVGERAAVHPGLLTAVAAKADATGARLAWVPRRAGDMGAIEAGCLPNVLPKGRPLSDAAARVDLSSAWGGASVAAGPGLSAVEQFEAASRGELKALVVAGVDPMDLADPAAALAGLENADFVISIEQRLGLVTERANVVFPAALVEEQAGHFINWEHRERPVSLVNAANRSPMTDLRILAALSDALGSDLGFRTPAAAFRDLAELGPWEGARSSGPDVAATATETDGIVLASWRELLDASSGNDHELALRATARPAVARLSHATAAQLGVGDVVCVGSGDARIMLPVLVTGGMADNVVWVPANPGVGSGDRLPATPGAVVTIQAVNADEGVQA
ncbi:NADH-quinone oxidoreductase subunit G [Tessaracoccus sp. OS52]|uniref:NADH-quinone oxidoreductase subunit G n=1 Tax=Tessaracoccus sp. OS52 TaxID=2886691 RepID=UPI001D12EE73|nr:NADH-quinone oxidoreductase subunit G [Tessaracoccus sp. OS52]